MSSFRKLVETIAITLMLGTKKSSRRRRDKVPGVRTPRKTNWRDRRNK